MDGLIRSFLVNTQHKLCSKLCYSSVASKVKHKLLAGSHGALKLAADHHAVFMVHYTLHSLKGS